MVAGPQGPCAVSFGVTHSILLKPRKPLAVTEQQTYLNAEIPQI